MMTYWTPLPPKIALELLMFTSPVVRGYAISRLELLTNNELFLYLLQLVQAVKQEPYHLSALAQFLIKRSVADPERIGHFFFWYLKVGNARNTDQESERASERERTVRACGE
jgi:phosphatidylinositol-4,5-bisphosphate 3-kinase catalytic subunit alpha/beta/delta